MTFSEETLMAYADNELDAQTRQAVEAAMAADPELARRVAQHKALRGKLRVVFDKTLEEPVPQRLVDTARGVPAVRREGNVIPLRRKAPSRQAWPQWVGLAASLVLGVIIGQAMLRSPPAGPITAARDGRLTANGVLAQALSEQLASTPPAQSPVRIGVSFKSKAGDYCRTFSLYDSTALAGLACREHDEWHVQALAQTTQPGQASNTYRQAAAEIPKSVMQAVEDNIAGDTLDAHAEQLARDKSWNP
jgi:hypothetical protein